MELGVKIKDLRLKNQLTQEELADRCELTKGFISQLENDLTSPSLATLTDILNSLGTTLAEFFSDEGDEQIVFAAADQFEKDNGDNVIRWLVPSAQKNAMEPILTTLNPGGSSIRDLPHEGEEFGLVLAGKIKLTVGKRTLALKEGDTFYFRSSKTHFIVNTGKSAARVVWVSCPPNF
ncbi:MAG: XRE family transcriptional regulator [Clostridiales bacterium]|jgi:transcriptional regulator with XRE-family HTH domain|nr:XRE family transcriptional regulator [Clostridiales bacterium]